MLNGPTAQVEQLYNGLLDRADQLREEMGEITDNVSLRTALETIWNDMAGDLRALQACVPSDYLPLGNVSACCQLQFREDSVQRIAGPCYSSNTTLQCPRLYVLSTSTTLSIQNRVYNCCKLCSRDKY